uniref:Transposase n=1 Tax=Angiostrongylus cantonensis TaxID=6313 RepID=A0A0K0DEF8_ANGCA
MIRYDVIGLAETTRRHPFNAVYDTGEELFLGRNMLQQRSRQCRRSRQHEFVHEHRFIRTAYDSNRTYPIKKIWINTGFDNLRRLRANIKL